jgi:hypothetical protein
MLDYKNNMQSNQHIKQYLEARKTSTTAYKYLYDQIKQSLETKEPIVIGKIGTNELLLIYCNYLISQGRLKSFPPDVLREIEYGAGLYPVDDETIETFIKVFLDSLSNVNVFASWNDRFIEFEHALYSSYIKHGSGIVELTALESFYTSKDQWWQTLFSGKCILVISPFTESIKKQLEPEQRKKVWCGKWLDFWPDDITFKFIRFEHPWSLLSKEEQSQSQLHLESSRTFSSKLKRFEKEINEIGDFDIALIGAGCYSLPLCSYIKNNKHRIAFHLGGGLQMMFGVYGARWNKHDDVFKEYINDAWIRPSGNEIPQRFKMQEYGAYF